VRRIPALAALVCAACLPALWIGAVATADPAGRSTLTETVLPTGSGFLDLKRGRGEPFLMRRGNVGPKGTRTRTRRSLVFFGQFTDPQIADEMSPMRAEFVDPVGVPGSGASGVASAWRPQEALGPVTFDYTIRNMNANRVSAVRQGNGARKSLNLVLTTGDLADNQQLNESRWYIQLLNGGTVDPFSGQAVSASNPCNNDAAETARLNAEVAARRYTGVQDYSDWRGRPADRYAGFWDPNEAAPTSGIYSGFPRYPGLMDRAQKPFVAQGSRVPWFTARGNHDGLTAGTLASTNALIVGLATSCLKIFPSQTFDPASQRGKEYGEVVGSFTDPTVQAQLLGGAINVPPDPNRKVVTKKEYKALHGTGTAHGYGLVDAAQNRASGGTASYYSFVRSGVRFIAMDTVAEGGGPEGNIDDPQYRWIESELRKAKVARQLVVVYGHHTLGTMRNTNADEKAGSCSGSSPLPGCDADPRTSTPLHRGLVGPKPMRDLLTRYPNVVALVVGHSHENRVTPYFRGGRGFWQLNTSAHIDWPQQSRQVEIMDNRDGSLSLFSRVLDQSGPLRTPAAGSSAASFTETDLAAISRRLSLNDPQMGQVGNPRGTARDRNVELLIRDPR
jgi:metallophosphoesterase (TIGR03767 family)